MASALCSVRCEALGLRPGKPYNFSLMFRILPKHIPAHGASERSVADYQTEPAPRVAIVTHDGQFQLVRFTPMVARQAPAFQWVTSAAQASATPMVYGLQAAILRGHVEGWSMWAGSPELAFPLTRQWAPAGRVARAPAIVTA